MTPDQKYPKSNIPVKLGNLFSFLEEYKSDKPLLKKIVKCMQEKPGIGTILRGLKPSQKSSLKTLQNKLKKDIGSNSTLKFNSTGLEVSQIEEKINGVIATRLSSFIFNTHSAARSAFIRQIDNQALRQIVNIFPLTIKGFHPNFISESRI